MINEQNYCPTGRISLASQVLPRKLHKSATATYDGLILSMRGLYSPAQTVLLHISLASSTLLRFPPNITPHLQLMRTSKLPSGFKAIAFSL